MEMDSNNLINFISETCENRKERKRFGTWLTLVTIVR